MSRTSRRFIEGQVPSLPYVPAPGIIDQKFGFDRDVGDWPIRREDQQSAYNACAMRGYEYMEMSTAKWCGFIQRFLYRLTRTPKLGGTSRSVLHLSSGHGSSRHTISSFVIPLFLHGALLAQSGDLGGFDCSSTATRCLIFATPLHFHRGGAADCLQHACIVWESINFHQSLTTCV